MPEHLVTGHRRYPGRGHHLQPGHLRVLHLRGDGAGLHPPPRLRHQTSALPDPALALRQYRGDDHGHGEHFLTINKQFIFKTLLLRRRRQS